MPQVLLFALGVYLAGCYAYGMVLVYRLLTTPMTTHPTSQREPEELIRAAKSELAETSQDEQRLAA